MSRESGVENADKGQQNASGSERMLQPTRKSQFVVDLAFPG